MSIKDTIVDSLKEDNAQMRIKVEFLVKKLTEVEISQNNLSIQGEIIVYKEK